MTEVGLPARGNLAPSIGVRGTRFAAWQVALALGALATAVYFVVPGGLPQGIFYELIGAAAVGAMAIALVRNRPARPVAWRLLIVGQASFVIGDLIFMVYELTGGTPFPSLADLIYVVGYPFIAVGVVLLVRGREGDGQASFIDAGIVAASAGMTMWLFLIGPIAADDSMSFIERIASAAYPVMDLLLVAIAARLMFSPSFRTPAHQWVLASLVLMLGSDITFMILTLTDGYVAGDPLDAAYLLAYVAIAVAALHPSVRSDAAADAAAEAGRGGLALRRLLLLGAAILVGPLAVLAESLVADPDDLPIAIGTILVAGLVLTRLVGITSVLRRSESRFRSLVQHATDVYAIVSADGMTLYESPAVQNVLGYPAGERIGRSGFELIHPEDAPYARRLLAELLAVPGGEVATEMRLRRADGTWCSVEMTGKNLVHDPAVRGVVINYRDVTQRTELQDQLRHQAFHDPLTGLANRALFMDRLQHALERRPRRQQESGVAVLFIDLDDFKAVNDGLGHAAGDEVLAAVAERIRGCLRAGDTAARVGGDEFAVLLEERVSVMTAERVATRLLESLREPFSVHGRSMPIRGSIGIALAPPNVDGPQLDADLLLRNADVAMYKAKLAGKGRYEVFEPGMHGATVARLQLRADLERAVEASEFVLYYQPFVDLFSGAPRGVEALLRWDDPERGIQLPGEFLTTAEESGLVVPIGRWVVSEACRQASTWRTTGDWPEGGRDQRAPILGVNLSVSQLRDPGLIDHLGRVLRETGIPPHHLVLEITEHVLLEDTEERIAELNAVKALGVRLAIDDFGIGYSSFNYLRRLPVDILKLDRSFVAGLEGSKGDRTVARAIIELGRTLGLDVIAEGVETEMQRAVLVDLGCEVGQGYLFGRPAPATKVSLAAA